MWEYKTVEGSVSVHGYCFQGNSLKVVQMLVLTFLLPFRIAHQNIRFIIIRHKTVFIFCHLRRAGWTPRAAGKEQHRPWPDHLWKSGLHSAWYKGRLWKCSAEQTGMCCVSEISCPPPPFLFPTEMDLLVRRHLCFLLSLQDWMSWFRTHECNFKFDCLLVYFMHLLLEEGETRF